MYKVFAAFVGFAIVGGNDGSYGVNIISQSLHIHVMKYADNSCHQPLISYVKFRFIITASYSSDIAMLCFDFANENPFSVLTTLTIDSE